MKYFGKATLLCATIGVAAIGLAGAAEVFRLITDDEVEAERRFEAQPENAPGMATRSLDAPNVNPASPVSIIVISPQPGNPTIASPVRIELAFATAADAHILPDSLRVRYGLLKIDITQRIRPYAKVTQRGILAEHAAIPPGNHRLFLQISDSAGRTAVSQLEFTVAR